MRGRDLVIAFDLPQMWNAVMQTTINSMAPYLQENAEKLQSEDGLNVAELEEATIIFKKNFRYFLAKKIEKICKIVISHGRYRYDRLKIVLIRDCSRKYNWRSLLIDSQEGLEEETPYKRVRNTRKRRFSTRNGVLEINVPPLLTMINDIIDSFNKPDLIEFQSHSKTDLFRLQVQNEQIKLTDGKIIEIGAEADDIIAIMCQHINRDKAYLVAISNDMDFCQLLDRFAHFQLYNIKGTHQRLTYNSRLVPHLIALKGKRSSGLKSLLKPDDINKIKVDIERGSIKRVSDLETRLRQLIRNPNTCYTSSLFEDLEYSLRCISFQEINHAVKSVIVHRLQRTTGLI